MAENMIQNISPDENDLPKPLKKILGRYFSISNKKVVKVWINSKRFIP